MPHVLELVDAIHALRLLLGVDEAAESGLELLAAGPMSHAAQARAVPVDLARLGVEGALLVGLGLQLLRRRRCALSSSLFCCLFPRGLGLGTLPALGGDLLEGGEVLVLDGGSGGGGGGLRRHDCTCGGPGQWTACCCCCRLRDCVQVSGSSAKALPVL